MKTLLPGSIIGILGGGQLGRMISLSASKLGYRCHIFCPDEKEPAVEISAFHTKAAFNDSAALEQFAQAVDVVTLEWENVPLEALEICAKYKPVHPSSHALRIAQDREKEKIFARKIGVGTADFAIVHAPQALEQALIPFKLPAILKSTRMGYDGKGQVTVKAGMNATDAWRAMGGEVGILESWVDFACEVSVIVARREDGMMKAFPAAKNIHKNGILAETHAPARIAADVAAEAEKTALLMADKLNVVGLLAVEMFVLRAPNLQGQRILMNEIAPRPHNSGHWTMDACVIDQFEQLVRAVCGLPLADTTPHSQAVMINLVGDDVYRWPDLLKEPRASLHLYGKTETRAGRKMGHVNILKGKWD